MDFEFRYELLGSLLLFTKTFYKLRTGREFRISEPIARESHFITISKALTRSVLDPLDPQFLQYLDINVPPRYGKTELCIHYVPWIMARYPDSNFLYISYSAELASTQTQAMREIMLLPEYRRLFGVELKMDSKAKHNFMTTAGGSVYSAGAGGTVTGKGAGIKNIERFGGAIIIDDIHKPKEVLSDTIRESEVQWYKNTLKSRQNSANTPIIFIGQRLHEADLPAKLIDGFDGEDWHPVVIPALDELNHALDPDMHSVEQLNKMAKTMPYEFAAQFQQSPQPAGGGIFKSLWFPRLVSEPDIYYTFITADTAETDKTYNDATVFSFWGLYNIKDFDIDTEIVGLHWIDCLECWIEPKDLEHEFISFYGKCMRHEVKPDVVAIEKKSVGVSLISYLHQLRGINVREIERTRASGSKATRFLATQSQAAQKKISVPAYAPHTERVLAHMAKITANNSHRYDDIADTYADAVQLALIDRTVGVNYTPKKRDEKMTSFEQRFAQLNQARTSTWLSA